MKLSVAIVDDLKPDRDRLRKDLTILFRRGIGHELSCSCYESAEAFLSAKPDVHLVFLDICMDGMSGIELARSLRELDSRLLIIFVSSSPEFAFDAFPVHPFDYLIKPYSPERLEHVVREALRVLHVADPKVAIRVARAVHNVPIGRIISVVSRGHVVEVAISGAETLRSIMTFSDIAELLENDARFLPVNRGVLINMDYALSLSDDTLLMKDGSTYVLRTRNRSELVSRFTQYQIGRLKGGVV